MSTLYYEQLALSWNPESKNERLFRLIATIVVFVMFAVGVGMSYVDVPKERRETRTVIPPRIASFMLDKKKKAPPKIEKPKPKPKPKPVEKPVVPKSLKKPSELEKPLTVSQQKARDKAAESGLLALSNELSDLMDTSDLTKQVSATGISTSASTRVAATQNSALLTDSVNKGSNGVNANEYATVVAKSSLSSREITQVRQALVAESSSAGRPGGDGRKKGAGGGRAEEDITIVFDQNKSKLYSMYERERRKNPGLKGKIVLEITIAASGKVTAVKILSSELNSPELESRLISRIKLINFGHQNVESVTVTYPIEFLPS